MHGCVSMIDSACLPLLHSTFVFETVSLSLFQLDFWASKLLIKNSPISASPRAGVTGLCHHVPEHYVHFRDPNSGLHASTANILPIEPPHQLDSLLNLIISEKYCLFLTTKPNSIFTRLIIHAAGNIIVLHFSKLSLQCSSEMKYKQCHKQKVQSIWHHMLSF